MLLFLIAMTYNCKPEMLATVLENLVLKVKVLPQLFWWQQLEKSGGIQGQENCFMLIVPQ